MRSRYPEPSLAELLHDSMTRALMQADGVDPVALETLLRRLWARIARRHVATPIAIDRE